MVAHPRPVINKRIRSQFVPLSPFGVTEIIEIVHAKEDSKIPPLAIFLDKLALPNLDRSGCQIGKGKRKSTV